MWFLRSRFVQIEETFWQRLTLPFFRLKLKLKRALQSLIDRLFAKRRARIFLDRRYPLFTSDTGQPGRWIDDPSNPRGRRWEGQRNWRSRIGPAIVCWECGAPASEAWNVRMPDGVRRHVRQSMFVWRRRADPPSVWTYGTLVLHPDDVTFVDLEKQPDYAPPDLKQLPNLEAELAHSPAFVADLQDDAFALTAFFFLAKKEWIKIGHPNAETFSGESEIASMIAGLRGKGEIYLDIRYQTLGGRERPLERGLFTQGQIRRLNRHLTSIGWRTHTPDEIEAMLREDLIQRLCARMELLRQVKDLETRPAKTYPAWKDEPRWILPITIYREGDDPAWLGQLTADEQEACSGRLSLRISALATSARIDQDEYDRLISVLVR